MLLLKLKAVVTFSVEKQVSQFSTETYFYRWCTGPIDINLGPFGFYMGLTIGFGDITHYISICA